MSWLTRTLVSSLAPHGVLGRNVRRAVRRMGYDVVRLDPYDTGVDAMTDIASLIDRPSPLILDVGANIGQSIHKFQAQFPSGFIHSFEPSPSTFSILKEKVGGIKGVKLWNLAIGAEPGELELNENTNSDMSSFLDLGNAGWGQVEATTVVAVDTVDRFCEANGIDYVDILKSDTQGFDDQVIQGAGRMLSEGRIRCVYAEVIFGDIYDGVASFGDTYNFLVDRGYRLVSFYKVDYRRGVACSTDVLFVHQPAA